MWDRLLAARERAPPNGGKHYPACAGTWNDAPGEARRDPWLQRQRNAQKGRLEAGGLHRARLHLSDARERSTGPAGEPGRGRAPPGRLHLSDARERSTGPAGELGRASAPPSPLHLSAVGEGSTGPAGELGRASAPPSPLHLSDVRALHGPGRPAWTREGFTGPGCTCPPWARAPRAQQARLDVRALHRSRCTRPTRARTPRAQQARLEARGLHRAPAAPVRRVPALTGPAGAPGRAHRARLHLSDVRASRARQASLDARGLHRARCTRPTRARAPRAQQGRLDARALHRARLHVSDVRALHGPSGAASTCPPGPLHLSDARALHGPSRRAWTREGCTGPCCTCPTRAPLHGPSRAAPTCPPGPLHLSDARAAPRARQARLDARGLHRARCTCPPCASAPRAQQARLDARGLHRARCTCPTRRERSTGQQARLDARGLHRARCTCPTLTRSVGPGSPPPLNGPRAGHLGRLQGRPASSPLPVSEPKSFGPFASSRQIGTVRPPGRWARTIAAIDACLPSSTGAHQSASPQAPCLRGLISAPVTGPSFQTVMRLLARLFNAPLGHVQQDEGPIGARCPP